MNQILPWLMGLLSFLPGFRHAGPQMWNGYVEEDYSYAAAASAGTIAQIAVSEGQLVRKGDLLFVLDQSQQQAQYEAARARADAAAATLDNLKTGSRQEEIDVTQATLMKAQADLAQLLGASRQRVNQELKGFEREGALRVEPTKLVVLSREKLLAIAEG